MVVVYGGDSSIRQLSGMPAQNIYPPLFIIYFFIQLIIYIRKKLAMRNMPSVQRMRSYVVNNYLNLNSLIYILLTMFLLMVATILYFGQVKRNQNSSDDEEILEGSYRALALMSLLETFIQLRPFIIS